eukprot:gene1162-1331_t
MKTLPKDIDKASGQKEFLKKMIKLTALEDRSYQNQLDDILCTFDDQVIAKFGETIQTNILNPCDFIASSYQKLEHNDIIDKVYPGYGKLFCMMFSMTSYAIRTTPERMATIISRLEKLSRNTNLTPELKSHIRITLEHLKGSSSSPCSSHIEHLKSNYNRILLRCNGMVHCLASFTNRYKCTPAKMQYLKNIVKTTPSKIQVSIFKAHVTSHTKINIYRKFIDIFGPSMIPQVALDLARALCSLKMNPLGSGMFRKMVGLFSPQLKSMMFYQNISEPLPRSLVRQGYSHPTSADLPSAGIYMACYYGAKKIIAFLITTPIVKYSHPLWWLCIENNLEAAISFIFDNDAEFDRVAAANPPRGAVTIMEILQYHKNQAFIDAFTSWTTKHGISIKQPQPQPQQAPSRPNSQLRAQAEKLKQKGNNLYSNGDFCKAVEEYTMAMDFASNDTEMLTMLYSNRSMAYYRLAIAEHKLSPNTPNIYRMSLNDAKEAIHLNPGWVKGHLRSGVALEALGRLQESIDAFQLGLQYDPTHEELLKHLEAARRAQDLLTESTIIDGFNEITVDVGDILGVSK